jgi:NitT/TauT family transport system ATP-binding protein
MLMVAGLLKTSQGTIRVGGKPLSGPLTDVGIAFQDHLLLDFRTAFDNVLLQGIIRGMPMEPVRERTRELFERLGLSGRCGPLPASAVGRHASARVARARPRAAPIRAADGRAVRRARRAHPAAGPLRSGAVVDGRPAHRAVHHPQRRGGGGLSDRVLVMSPSPGQVVEELRIDLPRPRPLALGEEPALAEHAKRIYAHFARLGVINPNMVGAAAAAH